MQKILPLKLIAILVLLVGSPQQVTAQEFSPDPDWKVSIYLWTLGIEGDIGIGPINAGIDLSFSDLFDALNYGGAVVMRRDWGRNVLVADLSYFSLSPDDVTGPLGGKISTDLNLPLLQFYYGRKTMLEAGHAGWLVGARYIKMDLTMGFKPNLPSEPTFRRSAAPDLTDFIVGGFYNRSINENWMFNLQGDIGTGGSDTTWNVQLIFQRKLQSGNMISMGIRVMDIDFDDRLSSGELFVMDARMSGLMIGFTWD
jgi:hypothetical protein